MNKELIEKLKDKDYVRAFGLMSKEEQECYREVGGNDCFVYLDSYGWSEKTGVCFFRGATYAIKPDFQPKLEYVKCIIEEYEGFLGIRTGNILLKFSCNFLHLDCIPSMPNFDHFELQHGGHIRIEGVAPVLAGGSKAYAAFRK